jgi:hypothetical protein
MERIIKFRGKSTITEEFVYGSLFNAATGVILIENGGECESDFHFVDPETVGQYTGNDGRGGSEIFEGDVVLDSTGMQYLVIWSPDESAFYLDSLSRHVPCEVFSSYNDRELQIKGNIHDK